MLSQIRGGTSLKKLDPEQVKREKAQRRAHIRKSMALLQDLQDTLTDALQTRQAAMLDSDEEDDVSVLGVLSVMSFVVVRLVVVYTRWLGYAGLWAPDV